MGIRMECENGVICGEGIDVVGDFVVIGTYDGDGPCRFEKRYCLNDVVIRYEGHHVNDGVFMGVSGHWYLDDLTERWWLERSKRQSEPSSTIPARHHQCHAPCRRSNAVASSTNAIGS